MPKNDNLRCAQEYGGYLAQELQLLWERDWIDATGAVYFYLRLNSNNSTGKTHLIRPREISNFFSARSRNMADRTVRYALQQLRESGLFIPEEPRQRGLVLGTVVYTRVLSTVIREYKQSADEKARNAFKGAPTDYRTPEQRHRDQHKERRKRALNGNGAHKSTLQELLKGVENVQAAADGSTTPNRQNPDNPELDLIRKLRDIEAEAEIYKEALRTVQQPLPGLAAPP